MNELLSQNILQSTQEQFVSGIKEKAVSSLQNSERLGDTFTHSVQSFITTSAQEWVANHPFIAWVLAHPAWTIGIIFLALFLGWGLIKAIADAIEQMWRFILHSPVRLLKKSGSSLVSKDPKQQLLETLTRLEALSQEQDELLRKVKEILASES